MHYFVRRLIYYCSCWCCNALWMCSVQFGVCEQWNLREEIYKRHLELSVYFCDEECWNVVVRRRTSAFGAPLHHVDFNLTLPRPNTQCDPRAFGKTDYMKNYFRFNIRIKASPIAFSQPSIWFCFIFRVSSLLIRACSSTAFSRISRSMYLFFLGQPISWFVHFFLFAVWTFYTVMRDEYSLEKSSPQLFKISSACADC